MAGSGGDGAATSYRIQGDVRARRHEERAGLMTGVAEEVHSDPTSPPVTIL